VVLTVPDGASDVVSGLLFDTGCCGLQDEEATPDEGSVRLTAYFESSGEASSTVKALEEGLAKLRASGAALPLGAAGLSVSEVPDVDWSAAWRAHFVPISVSPHVVVCAPWHRVQAPPGGCVVVIEPKMAFGTGSHETTQLALRGLEETLTRGGEKLLDVGTGSGILAIAAAKLGAAEVYAVDIDPQAVENARENVSLNGVGHRVTVAEGSVDDASGVYDTVVANILTSVLVPLLPRLAARVSRRGRLLLGGILAREEPTVAGAVRDAGLSLSATHRAGDWIGISATRQG